MRSGIGYFVPGPAGRLEALLEPVDGEARFAAAVCHPHPLYGGTLHNKVVHHVARALGEARVATLRFNFRGVGLSAGAHGDGIGEAGDLEAVLDHLERRYPGVGLLVAGYSFGAWVGLRRGARDPRVRALIGVGLATTIHDFGELRECVKPKLVVQGTADRLGPAAQVEELVRSWPEPRRLSLVEGADHFFAERLQPLRDAIRSHVEEVSREHVGHVDRAQ